MINEQTIEKLDALKLNAMANALRLYLDRVPRGELEPVELVGTLVDAEYLHRENQKLSSRLRTARFKEQAAVEEIDWKHPRGVTKAAVMELMDGRWLEANQNLIITGATGLGKTFLACAIGNKCCRDKHSVIFRRSSRLFEEFRQARGDGTYAAVLRRVAKARLLILDDFGLEALDAVSRHDLLEILEDRYNVSSTLITSQFPPDKWHALISDDTHADSILDRLVHNARRIVLNGESIRKTRGQAALAPQPPPSNASKPPTNNKTRGTDA